MAIHRVLQGVRSFIVMPSRGCCNFISSRIRGIGFKMTSLIPPPSSLAAPLLNETVLFSPLVVGRRP